MECTQNKSYLTFSSSDSSFMKYPEVSLNNLSFYYLVFYFIFKLLWTSAFHWNLPPSITSM